MQPICCSPFPLGVVLRKYSSLLASNAARFGVSVADAQATKERAIDEPLNYAIINNDGILLKAIGGISVYCVSHRRGDPHTGLVPLAHAVCRHWVRIRGVYDAGRLHVQDGQRPRQLTNNSQRTWELMGATLADGSVAVLIILAMSFGLIVPKLIIDAVTEKLTRS